MKLFQILTSTMGLLLSTTYAQQDSTIDQSSAFNLSAINGTWHVAGLTDTLVEGFAEISQYLNFSIKCPQIYITGNTTNVSYVQPSFNLEYYNESLGRNLTANISMSGLMTLENVTSPTEANFSVLLAFPTMDNGTSYSSTNNLARILAAGSSYSSSTTLNITAGNVTDPLPNGANISATFGFNLSSSNGSVYDIVLLTASNFSVVSNSSDSSNGNFDDQDNNGYGGNMTEQVYQLLLTNTSTVLNQTIFNQTIDTFGTFASNVTRLNNTCSKSFSSRGGGSQSASVFRAATTA
ncbi:hypothetical protein A0J61_06433 [Choanephora cucurbitarum]|uniref:Lipocalin-like domain-containing protein n=1 Tax=Choanephora cucurbitarum TaxID=101091 RepID=A0A1C7N8Q3_9FUNG|nr:hypothetical protein A0J61_06433 [Choanephora cucurbitarum]